MAGTVAVRTEALRAEEQYVLGLTATLRAAVRSAALDVVAMADGSWTGAAAQSFRTAFGEWQEGASQLLETLETLAQLLQTAAVTYDDRDEAAARTLARISTRL